MAYQTLNISNQVVVQKKEFQELLPELDLPLEDILETLKMKTVINIQYLDQDERKISILSPGTHRFNSIVLNDDELKTYKVLCEFLPRL